MPSVDEVEEIKYCVKEKEKKEEQYKEENGERRQEDVDEEIKGGEVNNTFITSTPTGEHWEQDVKNNKKN